MNESAEPRVVVSFHTSQNGSKTLKRNEFETDIEWSKTCEPFRAFITPTGNRIMNETNLAPQTNEKYPASHHICGE